VNAGKVGRLRVIVLCGSVDTISLNDKKILLVDIGGRGHTSKNNMTENSIRKKTQFRHKIFIFNIRLLANLNSIVCYYS